MRAKAWLTRAVLRTINSNERLRSPAGARTPHSRERGVNDAATNEQGRPRERIERQLKVSEAATVRTAGGTAPRARAHSRLSGRETG